MNSTPPVIFAIPDLQTGCEIIARFPLANPPQAEIELDRFLDCLLTVPPDAETYFRLLDHLGVAATFIADELSKRYLNKTLPLGEIEEAFFQKLVSVWRKMSKAYSHCAQIEPAQETEAAHALRLATLLHRCIHYTGMSIVEHQRARREMPWGLWLDLHAYYASAEEWGVDNIPVPAIPGSHGHGTQCAAAYVSVLLCDMAGCYSLSVREQTLVRRWSTHWSALVSLHKAEPGETLPAFVIDLMHDGALRPVAECLQTDQIRRLDTTALAQQIRQTRQQLKQRIAPAQLALGEDCSSGQCSRLLEHLSRPWSQARGVRKFRRHATSGTARLCSGFDEMHYFISGKEFAQPDSVRTYNRQEYDTLFAFRHQVDPLQTLQVHKEQLGFSTDTWEVVNQSANGFRLVRSLSGRKMAHSQLLALCPHDSERFLLARISWLMQERGGGLISGIEALPGMPSAIAARVLEPGNELGSKFHRAFLLPALPSIGAEQSLVLPPGWYRSGRLIELYTETPWQVRLTQILDDGADFERVGFVIC